MTEASAGSMTAFFAETVRKRTKKIEVAAYTNRYRSRVDSTPGVMAQPDNQ